MPNWRQNDIKIDATTHNKSMPKLVTRKFMEIIKNHVSLNGKTIEIQYKNKCFWRFSRLRARTEKGIKQTSTNMPNPLQHRWTNQCKSYTRKNDATNINIFWKWRRKGSPKSWTTNKKGLTKIDFKKNEMKKTPEMTLSPSSSQRKLRHSAGKLNWKKTKLQRRRNLHTFFGKNMFMI